MSRKLSKVLVICAMVVIFPLMIVGSAFAAYYSINATVKVGIYTNANSASDNAYANVVYNAKANNVDFEVTNSHVKTITLKANANGYNFIGWFDGSLKSYIDAKNANSVKYLSEKDVLQVKLSDYANVLAVFEIQTYGVNYAYKENATDATITSDVPVGGKASYNYGDVLPTLKTEHYTFLGWDIVDAEGNVVDNNNGSHYMRAEFNVLDSYILSAVWQENAKMTVTYKDGETEITDTSNPTIYENENYALPDASTLSGKTAADGCKYVWKDANGSVITTANKSITVYLSEVECKYSVNIVGNDDIYVAAGNSNTLNFTNTNDTLNVLFEDSYWDTTYSYWEFASVTFNGTDYSAKDALKSAIIATSKNADKTVDITVNVKKYFNNIAITKASYKGSKMPNTTMVACNEDVYIGEETKSVLGENTTFTGATVSETMAEWLDEGINFYVKDGEEYVEVFLEKLLFTVNGIRVEVDYDANKTIAEVIEEIYTNEDVEIALVETLTISNLILNFFPAV